MKKSLNKEFHTIQHHVIIKKQNRDFKNECERTQYHLSHRFAQSIPDPQSI